ncbi:MAG: HAD hydrolase family protein [Thermoplasmata archaeon]
MAARPRSTSRPSHRLRAVVTDIDGTLTNEAHRLDPAALEVVHRLVDRRIPVLLATGNVLPVALGIYRSLGLSSPVIAENGGVLYVPSRSGDRVERLGDRALAERAYRRLVRSGLPVRRLFTDRWRESEVALDTSVPVRTIRSVLRHDPIQVQGSGFAIHLMSPKMGKLPALRRALAGLHLEPSDCLVLGDGDNDVEMLKAAGWSVSFPNGSRAARAAAAYVTRRNHSKGFVEGVKSSGILRS